MNVYMTEEEQLEQIKKWWRKYGNSILSAIIVVMLIITAYHWWQHYQAKVSAAASNSYEALIQSVANGDDSGVAAETNNLIQNYPNTVYATVAALVEVKQAVYRGNLELAMQRLNWVMSHSHNSEYLQLARIRAARIKKSQQDYPAALALLDKVDDADYLSLIYETRGDIYAASDNKNDAKKNYALALAAFPDSGAASPMLHMKLNDL